MNAPEPRATPAEAAGSPQPPAPQPTAADPSPWLAVVSLLVAHVAAFWWGCVTLVDKWTVEGGYYSHGPLALGVVGWLLWRDREALSRIPRRASWLGLPLLAVAIWLLLGSRRAQIAVVEHYALLLSLFGSTLVVFGWQVARRTWFAWAYTALFAIPLPALIMDSLTWRLKLWATQAAFVFMELLGASAVSEGGTIHFAGGQSVLVDDVCSGLRSLVTLLALAALFAYLQPTRWRAVLSLSVALPLALFANMVRVLFLSWCALREVDWAFAEPWHGLTGVVVYLVALAVLGAIHGRPGEEPVQPAASVSDPAASPGRAAQGWLVAVCVLALTATGFYAQFLFWQIPERPIAHAQVTTGIPSRVGRWDGTDVALRYDLPGLLRTDDYVLREYRAPGEEPVELFVLYGDSPEAGLHGPQGCYLLQGFRELELGEDELAVGSAELEVGRALIERIHDGRRALVYFFYRVGPKHQSLPLGQHALRRGRLLSEALWLTPGRLPCATIRFSTRVDEGVDDAESRLRRFAAEVLPAVQAELPTD